MKTEPTETLPNSLHPRGLGWLLRNAGWLVWVYWACLFSATHVPLVHDKPPKPPHPLDPVLQWDKLVHFGLFAGLMTMLVLSGVGARGRSWHVRCRIALVIALVYAAIDESTQWFIVGRGVDPTDYFANGVGILSVYVIALLPARRDAPPRPKALTWSLAIMTPLILAGVLSPWVMRQGLIALRVIVEPGSLQAYPMDQLAHGFIALVVSVYLIVAWPMASKRPRRAGGFAIALLLLSGPLIEIAQHYTGRGVEATDVLAHNIGLAIAMLWWALQLSRRPELRQPADAPLPSTA